MSFVFSLNFFFTFDFQMQNLSDALFSKFCLSEILVRPFTLPLLFTLKVVPDT